MPRAQREPDGPVYPDLTKLITQIQTESDARELPPGTAVGDSYGGRTFTDNVAAILESRSYGGWREVQDGETLWTVIVIAR